MSEDLAQPVEIDSTQTHDQAQAIEDPVVLPTTRQGTEGLVGEELAKEIDRMEDMLGGHLGEKPAQCFGTLLPRDTVLRNLWTEWFDGTAEQISIWALNMETEGTSLAEKVQSALLIVEGRTRDLGV